MLKIAVTGPESCGKTSLAEDIAKHYRISFIPEFAREYLLNQKGIYTATDLDVIANGQFNAIELAAKNQKNLLISDTEMLVMCIWSEVKFGFVSSQIQSALSKQNFDHYFICDTDIPWEPDPLRENEHDRDELLKLYLDKTKQMNYSFTLLSGNHQTRLKKAVEIIDRLLDSGNYHDLP
ncbi:MAG: ATP-binding protein [Crocinitomicaceae bacterium]|nr:ATP-binding protein [Crocinitomicaceae bacterium]MBK8925567.1 ATP-binding protein [Crocinitomicaceae bacterium]